MTVLFTIHNPRACAGCTWQHSTATRCFSCSGRLQPPRMRHRHRCACRCGRRPAASRSDSSRGAASEGRDAIPAAIGRRTARLDGPPARRPHRSLRRPQRQVFSRKSPYNKGRARYRARLVRRCHQLAGAAGIGNLAGASSSHSAAAGAA